MWKLYFCVGNLTRACSNEASIAGGGRGVPPEMPMLRSLRNIFIYIILRFELTVKLAQSFSLGCKYMVIAVVALFQSSSIGTHQKLEKAI